MIGVLGRKILSGILLFVFLVLGGLTTEAAPPSNAYTLKLFNEDAILRNPNSGVSGYFELYPGSSINGPAMLDLWFSYSPTVKTELSTITISLNGTPVVSRFLEAQQSSVSNWQIMLPPELFRPGVNDVNVSVVHRSIDGLCRDIDNSSNWFIIRPETRISFNLLRAPYSLGSYPQPFVDNYLATNINTSLYVPQNPDALTLGALFNLASQWGAYGIAGAPQRLDVLFGDPAGQPGANEVVFASIDKWFPALGGNGGQPFLSLQESNGFNRLVIAAQNSEGFNRAVSLLGRPKLVQSFVGQQLTLPTSLSAESPATVSSNAQKGKYTLTDLGYQDDIAVEGAFHQSAVLNVPRPPNYKVGNGSYVELHFRHSKILDPKKSAVTVYVNEIPIRSAALTPENAERGVLKVPIPESELNKSFWRVRFGFYHDLGIIDCSKRYDDVAWSVVEKGTSVVLEKGQYERYPALEDFPNNFTSLSTGAIPLTLVLNDNPTAEEVTAAFKMAYFIGQQNRSKISWQVQFASSIDLKKAEGTVIVLGKNSGAKQWDTFKKYLAVLPLENASYQTASWLEVLPETLSAFDIFQINKLDNGHLLYSVMYASPARLDKLFQLMMTKGSSLSGQVTLVDVQGLHKTFISPQAANNSGISMEWLSGIWSVIGGTATVYLMIFITVLAATVALMVFVRKRR